MDTPSSTIDIAKYVLPDELFRYFILIKVEELPESLHFYLDELPIFPEEYLGQDMVSHGFHSECVIKDFPLREKSLYLHVRRRRWLNKTTGNVVSRDWNLVAEGTHYTQGFASFLKAFVRYIPDSVQFT
jgi:hypothetical protein